MKHFLKKIFLILIPLVIMMLAAILWDPYKIFFHYKSDALGGNREDVCLKLFNRLATHKQLNSFIIGDSRSLAFKISCWKDILIQNGKKEVNSFHFDGNGVGLFRTRNILRYLDKNTDTISNILLIFDNNTFDEISNPKNALAMEPPAISGESPLPFYFNFIRSCLYHMYILSNLDFNITGRYKPYMKPYIGNPGYIPVWDTLNGDFIFGYDKQITEDSIGYYQKKIKENVFYKRNPRVGQAAEKIGPIQLAMLNQIKQIFIKNKTNVKIAVCPLYDQVPFNSNDKMKLFQLFGNENVFDYSGKNHFTESISNYYEESHFKPIVGYQIMKEIYLR